MGLETGVTYIDDLVSTNPDGSVDTLDESDNHHRIIKTAIQGSFPSLGAAAVTKTAAEINDLLEKAGGVMTGNLEIEKASPLAILDSTSGNGALVFSDNGTDRAYLAWSVAQDAIDVQMLDTDGVTVRANINLTETGDVDVSVGTFKIGGTGSITAIRDEDNMSSDDVNALATQQSIKKYTDDATTSSAIGAKTAGLGVGAIGTYAFCVQSTGTYAAGATISGSLLTYASIDALAISSSGTPSGTWRCMGYATSGKVTLWLRIS